MRYSSFFYKSPISLATLSPGRSNCDANSFQRADILNFANWVKYTTALATSRYHSAAVASVSEFKAQKTTFGTFIRSQKIFFLFRALLISFITFARPTPSSLLATFSKPWSSIFLWCFRFCWICRQNCFLHSATRSLHSTHPPQQSPSFRIHKPLIYRCPRSSYRTFKAIHSLDLALYANHLAVLQVGSGAFSTKQTRHIWRFLVLISRCSWKASFSLNYLFARAARLLSRARNTMYFCYSSVEKKLNLKFVPCLVPFLSNFYQSCRFK